MMQKKSKFIVFQKHMRKMSVI